MFNKINCVLRTTTQNSVMLNNRKYQEVRYNNEEIYIFVSCGARNLPPENLLFNEKRVLNYFHTKVSETLLSKLNMLFGIVMLELIP